MNMLSHIDVRPKLPPAPAPEPAPFGWLLLAGGFLRRRLPIVLLVMTLVSCLGLLLVSQQAETFVAGTSLLFDQRRADVFQGARAMLDTQGNNAQIESQVEVLRSEGLALQVVRRLNLADTRHDMAPGAALIAHRPMPIKTLLGIGTASGPPPDDALREAQATETLSHMIAVRRVGLTFVIEIAVVAETPQAAARLANGLVEAYVAQQLAGKSEATREASAWLHARIGELSVQAKNADEAVQAFKTSHNIVATDEGLISEQQLSSLSTKLALLRAITVAAKAQRERVKLALTHGDAAGAVIGDGLQSPITDSLRQKLVDKQRQYVEWRARFGAGHEVVRRLQDEIVELKAGLQSELRRILGTAENSVAIAEANEAAAQAQVDANVGQSGRVNTDRVELRALQSEADTYRTLYASFLQRFTQAAQDQSFPVADVQVVSPATPPLHKSGPRRGLIVGGSAVLGLGLGLLAGLVGEIASGRAPAKGPGRSARGLECLGTLPRLQAETSFRGGTLSRLRRLFLGGPRPDALLLPRSGPAGMLRLGIDRPDEPFGLAVAAMRREILRRVSPANEGRVIGCLTLNSGDGTTTVAANLAHALAQGGHRTVLVDMADGANAATRVMGGQAAEADGFGGRMHQDRTTGLLFRPTPSPIGAILNTTGVPAATMASVVKSLQRKHDFVIIDLPAVERRMPSHDILMQVDDLLMIGSWTEQDEARMLEVPDLAAASAVRCLGIVLTMVPPHLCDVV